MQTWIFVRLHARVGAESDVEAAIRDTIPPSLAEDGCLAIEAFRAADDVQAFSIHSRWADAAAIQLHAGLPHTVAFLDRVRPLVDRPIEMTRAQAL